MPGSCRAEEEEHLLGNDEVGCSSTNLLGSPTNSRSVFDRSVCALSCHPRLCGSWGHTLECMPPWRMMKLPWKHARQCASQQSHDFRSSAAAEGQGQPQAYDWSKSTAENYSSPDRHFFGPYASIRSDRDHAYHGNYVRPRQAIQDKLITSILWDDWTPRSTSTSNPWVVFTCGAMGAGKSHVVTWMRSVWKYCS